MPPAQAGKLVWHHSLTGHAQRLIFEAARETRSMTPLLFEGNRALDPSVASSRALLGWRFGSGNYVLVNAAAATVLLDTSALTAAKGADPPPVSCSVKGSFTKGEADITRAGMTVSELGTLEGTGCATNLTVPGYAIISLQVRGLPLGVDPS